MYAAGLVLARCQLAVVFGHHARVRAALPCPCACAIIRHLSCVALMRGVAHPRVRRACSREPTGSLHLQTS